MSIKESNVDDIENYLNNTKPNLNDIPTICAKTAFTGESSYIIDSEKAISELSYHENDEVSEYCPQTIHNKQTYNTI
jgi:hypothetical protein